MDDKLGGYFIQTTTVCYKGIYLSSNEPVTHVQAKWAHHAYMGCCQLHSSLSIFKGISPFFIVDLVDKKSKPVYKHCWLLLMSMTLIANGSAFSTDAV